MKKFMIKIEDNMCKNDEIAIIDRLEQEYLTCPDNYLHDFFTGQNVEWLRNKIQDDFFPPEPWKMECRIVNQDIEIKNLRDQLGDLRAREKVINDTHEDLLAREQLIHNGMERMQNQIEKMETRLIEKDKILLREHLVNNHLKNKIDQIDEILGINTHNCAKNPDTCGSIPPGSCGPNCHGFECR